MTQTKVFDSSSIQKPDFMVVYFNTCPAIESSLAAASSSCIKSEEDVSLTTCSTNREIVLECITMPL